MPEKPKKKTLLDKAIDAVSDRDEKAAAEEARKKAEAAKAKAAALKAKMAADKAKTEQQAKVAAKVAAHKAEVARLAAEKAAAEKAAAEKAAAEKAAAEAAAKPVRKYVLKEGDTWTHVSLKFYGHITEPYWRPIYEANKEMVGPDYRRIWPGMEIIIPDLPDELKDKK